LWLPPPFSRTPAVATPYSAGAKADGRSWAFVWQRGRGPVHGGGVTRTE